jgi:hypothetical protein
MFLMSELDNRLDRAVRSEKLCTGGVKDMLADVPYTEHLQIVRDLAARNPSLDLQIKSGSTPSDFSFEMKLPSPAAQSPVADKVNGPMLNEMAKIMGMTSEQFKAKMQETERQANSGVVNFYRETANFYGKTNECSDIKKLF